jgi:hypothetical protein
LRDDRSELVVNEHHAVNLPRRESLHRRLRNRLRIVVAEPRKQADLLESDGEPAPAEKIASFPAHEAQFA